jgi:hypothetical protein
MTVSGCGEAAPLIKRFQALAWVIVQEGRQVPAETIRSLHELAEGLVDQAHWPPDLDAHAIEA